MYTVEGRLTRSIPTVSETTTECPNARVMPIGFGSVTLIAVYTVCFRIFSSRPSLGRRLQRVDGLCSRPSTRSSAFWRSPTSPQHKRPAPPFGAFFDFIGKIAIQWAVWRAKANDLG
jgi:hypothetical protein